MHKPTSLYAPTRKSEPMADSGLYLLYLAALPLVLMLFQASVAGMVGAALQLALFAFALRMIFAGLRVEEAFDAAEVARRPRLPRKLLGSGLIGLLVLVMAGLQFHMIFAPLVLGLIAFSLSVLAFGLDPIADKGFDDARQIEKRRIEDMARKVSCALETIVTDVDQLEDDDLSRQTDALRIAIERLFRTASRNPTHLKHMRKPLRRLIEIQAEEVARLSAEWTGPDRAFARRRYLAKLATLGRAFEDRARKIGLVTGGDMYELEADLLLDRMAQDQAA